MNLNEKCLINEQKLKHYLVSKFLSLKRSHLHRTIHDSICGQSIKLFEKCIDFWSCV
jgi:hypothetical protein